jgi:hypothetical protein
MPSARRSTSPEEPEDGQPVEEVAERQEIAKIEDEQPKPTEILQEQERPAYRKSYPAYVPLMMTVIPSFALIVVGDNYNLSPQSIVVGIILICCVVALWWNDSKRELRQHKPPPGWKSEVMPKKLKYQQPKDFNRLRFALQGENDDSVDNHEVQRATRYSRVTLVRVYVLAMCSCLCLVGAILAPSITLGGSGGELPHRTSIVWYWVAGAVIFGVLAYCANFEWRCTSFMYDERYIYDLKVWPAWLPWIKETNNPIPLSIFTRADPEDTSWGKRWNHGSVVLYLSMWEESARSNYRTRFDRIPEHVEVCNEINSRIEALRRSGSEDYSPMPLGR